MTKIIEGLKLLCETICEMVVIISVITILIGTMGIIFGISKLIGDFVEAPVWFQFIGALIGLLYGIIVISITATHEDFTARY